MQVLILISAGMGLISGAAVTTVVDRLVGVLSWRRTFVATALATGLVDGALMARLHHLHLTGLAPAVAYFAAMAAALSIIDVRTHRLPNAIVLPSYPVLALLLTGAAATTPDWPALGRAALGGAACFGAHFLLALAYPPGLGFGDVKVAGLVGTVATYLSWSALLGAVFIGFLAGGVTGLALIAARRATRRTALPFGPFLLGGAVLVLLMVHPAGS